ncbi:MAG: cell division protein FtsK [Gammaproteobacteria bacterium]|nr:MAG: cell division protein FtsK [Pseudomonadota bacterium]PIE38034.1 MAG: cell division protein FtsK [Gammaproteobacteria bacterium]
MSQQTTIKDKQQQFHTYVSRGAKEGALIGLIALCVYLMMALVSYNPDDPGWATTGSDGMVTNYGGRAGAWFASVLFYFFGHVAFLFPVLLAFRAWQLFLHRKLNAPVHWPLFMLRFAGFVLILAASTSFLDLYSVVGLGVNAGGVIGNEIAVSMVHEFNRVGTTLLLVPVLLFGITLFTGISWFTVMDALGSLCLRAVDRVRQLFSSKSNSGAVGGTAQSQVFPRGKTPILLDRVPDHPVDRREQPGKPEKGLFAGLMARVKSLLPNGNRTQAHTTAADTRTGSAKNVATESLIEKGMTKKGPTEESPIKASSAKQAPSGRGKLSPGPDRDIEIKPLETRKKKTGKRAIRETQGSLFDVSEGPLPSIAILDPPDRNKTQGFSPEYLKSLSHLLETKLKDFGVIAEVVAVNPGPVITRFEIQPAPGVKVAKISNLAKDLARSLAVLSVRVVEVIRGKSVVGIEIPNEVREVVRFSEVLYSDEYEKADSPLALALGNDIAGNAVIANLAKMPHLLVAGTTGSGKSVGINAMILSILFKASPDDVRFLMVDPKMLELSIYEGIPHLLAPVVTDMKEAANGLRWCVAEMERRYKLMASMGVRNIAGFNRKVKEAESQGEPLKDPLWQPDEMLDNTEADRPDLETLPFIVVVIDEFADMMMIVGKKVEELIARIAQKARAAGIHLILATQRPSVDVITGLIKANIPTRISFLVSSKVDSRTIIDQGGAEQLLGHGDMLYLPPGTSLPERVHGAFVSDDEVHRLVAEWKKRGEPDYINAVLEGGDSDAIPGMSAEGGDGGEGSDPLYDEAVAFVTESRRASISSVQRKLKIGYNRAANLVESMEAAGVVSPAGHNGAREVIAPPPPKG